MKDFVHKPKILIVDDEGQVVDLLMETLSRSLKGYDIRGAYGGQEALRMLKEQDFVLALIDINLRDMNGLNIIRILKENKKLPKIIVVSAMSDKSNSKTALDLGAIDFITKPVAIEYLLARVKKALNIE